MIDGINSAVLLTCTVFWVLSFFVALSIVLRATTKNVSPSIFVNWTGIIKQMNVKEKRTFYVVFFMWLVLTLPAIAFIAESLKN